MRILMAVLLLSSSFLSAAEYFTLKENKKLKLPFSDAVRVGDIVYISGAIGVTPGTGNIVKGGIEKEAEQTMKNIGLVLKRFYDLDYENIIRCQVMIEDIKTNWPKFNAVYTKFFKPPYPARSAFGASGLALGAQVEVECMAEVR